MAQADRVQQFIEWRSRRGRHSIEHLTSLRLDELKRTWEAGSVSDEVSDFFPIRTVTLLEVFVREWVRRMIDRGNPYLDRAAGLSRNIKFDFLLSAGLQSKKITVGDIIAHSISVNDLSKIISTFDILLDGEFKNRIVSAHNRYEANDFDIQSDPIIENYNIMSKMLDELFRVRHILVHEMPLSKPYDIQDIGKFIWASMEFVEACDEVFTFELDGPVPLTQAEWAEVSYKDLRKEEAALAETLAKVRLLRDIDSSLLDAAQGSWENFSDKEARLYSSLVRGGSMEPTEHARARAELIRKRIIQLSWWLEREEGDLL